jgi:hypothetical protein
MDADRQTHVMTLRRRIEQSRYEVDPTAVAAAIVERLVPAPPARTPGASGRSPSPRSGDVLEAG